MAVWHATAKPIKAVNKQTGSKAFSYLMEIEYTKREKRQLCDGRTRYVVSKKKTHICMRSIEFEALGFLPFTAGGRRQELEGRFDTASREFLIDEHRV